MSEQSEHESEHAETLEGSGLYRFMFTCSLKYVFLYMRDYIRATRLVINGTCVYIVNLYRLMFLSEQSEQVNKNPGKP